MASDLFNLILSMQFLQRFRIVRNFWESIVCHMLWLGGPSKLPKSHKNAFDTQPKLHAIRFVNLKKMAQWHLRNGERKMHSKTQQFYLCIYAFDKSSNGNISLVSSPPISEL